MSRKVAIPGAGIGSSPLAICDGGRRCGCIVGAPVYRGVDEIFPARRDIVRAAKQAAISRDGDNATGITIDLCPNGDEINEYADALEMVYPGYGRRLVLLAFHCGARIMELAALRADDLDPDQLTVTIGAQLDRNRPWPATRLPKNH